MATICPTHIAAPRVPPSQPKGLPRTFLSAAFIDHINREYKRKTVESKASRIPNLNLNPINLLPAESFASSPVVGSKSGISSGIKGTTEAVVAETSDLGSFSRSTSVVSKDPIESLQLVWTGKMGPSLTYAKQLQEMGQRRAAEEKERERDAENKSDARSGEDDESLLKQGIFAIKQR